MDVPPKTRPRLFLIDAYALIYRSYFAFISRPLVSSKGEHTSAPFGFTQFLERVLNELDPDYLAVVFDAGKSFREEMYSEYKATRERMPDELAASLPRIREICAGYRIPVVELEGYEADDVIGTLAIRARAAGLDVVIVSGDKDFYQLVGPGVALLNPGRGGPVGVDAEYVDETAATEKLGVAPGRVVDYLALIGDSSDNVPGAPGIGPKTAVKLLDRFGSIEELLERADEVAGRRARESLLEHADEVRLSKQLVTILTDLPVDLELERFEVGEADVTKLRDLFVDLEFRRLAEEYARAAVGGEVDSATEAGATPILVLDVDGLQALVARVREEGSFSLATATTTLDPLAGALVALAMAVDVEEVFYLPFAHRPPAELELGQQSEGVVNLPSLHSEACRGLVAVLEDASIRKVGHDLKRHLIALSRADVMLRGTSFDAMVASYVLDPGRRDHGLSALAVDLLSRQRVPYAEVAGRGKIRTAFEEVPMESARDFVCQEAELALRLTRLLEPDLERQGLDELLRELEMPLVSVLAGMQQAGIRIDVPFFHEASHKLAAQLELIQQEIFKIAGQEFNVNSTPQIREILFDRLGLPVLKRTKTGPSTDATVLEELATLGHEIPRLLMEFRELEKLRSTYVDALPRLVNPRTGRIHTSFNQAVAATGRLSSSDPNLQNIPIRTSIGREIRKGFVADAGQLLLGVDYSQVELRILAHFSGDEAFVTAFREGIDVHRQTAAVIFGVEVDDVSAAMRAQAKTINFATLYGQGAFSLARQLGISREQAQTFIDGYFERFSGVRTFLDEQIEKAKEYGYVETLLGRRRYVPELQSRSWNVRQFGERVAQNTPIQGTAADLIKKAMIAVDEALRERGYAARMLLQVHDELLFEVPEEEVDAVRELVVELMEGAMELAVPLEADWGVGKSWFDAKA